MVRLVRQYVNYRGYQKVILCKNHDPKNYLVHRLVALAFVKKKRRHYNCIDHIDGNQLNNLPANLDWCTQKINVRRYWASKRAA